MMEFRSVKTHSPQPEDAKPKSFSSISTIFLPEVRDSTMTPLVHVKSVNRRHLHVDSSPFVTVYVPGAMSMPMR